MMMEERMEDGLGDGVSLKPSNHLGKRNFLSISSVDEEEKGKFVSEGDSSLLKFDFNTWVKTLQQNFQVSGEETDSDTTKTLNHSNAPTNTQGMEAGDFDSNTSTSIGGSILSSGSKESKLQKCAFLNYGSASNASTGTDLLKTCSCSFCLKAAHIWSDLQYQDTKGRIAALKRSRKDVRSVIETSITYGGFGKTVLGNSNRPTKLEHDLMGQWRSLFLHTEDVLIRENSQLDSNLFNLKELRDYCKSNLATINVNSSNC